MPVPQLSDWPFHCLKCLINLALKKSIITGTNRLCSPISQLRLRFWVSFFTIAGWTIWRQVGRQCLQAFHLFTGGSCSHSSCFLIKINPFCDYSFSSLTKRKQGNIDNYKRTLQSEAPCSKLVTWSLGSFVMGLLHKSIVFALDFVAFPHHDSHHSHSWGRENIGTVCWA